METGNGVLESEDFYLEITRPLLKDFVIEADSTLCPVAHSINRNFLLIVGKRAETNAHVNLKGKTNQRVEFYLLARDAFSNFSSSTAAGVADHYLQHLWAFLRVRNILENTCILPLQLTKKVRNDCNQELMLSK